MHVLIPTYHFPPLNVVASRRAAGFAKFFSEYGWKVSVLTFDWEGEFEADYDVIRLPLPEFSDRDFGWKAPGISGIKTLNHYRRGEFDWHVKNHAQAMKMAMESFIDHHKPDLLFGMFSPHFHITHCAEFGKKHGIPFHIDFRDLWNNHLMNPHHKFGSKESILHGHIKSHWRQWCEGAISISSVADSFVEFLEKLLDRPGITVLNGPDEIHSPSSDKFETITVGHFGNLLPAKDVKPFLEGFSELDDEEQQKIDLRFWGAPQELKDRILHHAQELGVDQCCIFEEKVLHEEALRLMRKCHALYYPPILGHKGMYSAKVFEYVASGTPVIISPDDQDVVSELVQSTGTGVICKNPKGVKEALSRLINNDLAMHPNTERLVEISRKSQTFKLARFIESRLK